MVRLPLESVDSSDATPAPHPTPDPEPTVSLAAPVHLTPGGWPGDLRPMRLGGAVQSVLTGFATIAIVIALGALLAHTRVLGIESQGMLARLTFYLASPALMVTVLGNTDVAQLFSANLLASLGSVVVAASVAIVLVRLVWRRSGSDSVIATFCACYVNAGNLGLPIAAYVLGNVSLIAPMLL